MSLSTIREVTEITGIEETLSSLRNGGVKIMKRIVAAMIAMMLMLTLAGCGNDDTSTAEQEAITTEESSAAEETAPSEEAAPSEDAEESSNETETGSGVLSPEFKKTMDDYEAWFDHYCEVMKKYQDDPSDLELLSEMSELIAEEGTMFDEMENMDESEMNTAELAYYLEVTARIEKKLLEVADY